MSSQVLLRAALVAVAVAAVAFLGAGLRASNAASDGAAIVNGAGERTPIEAARALDLLRDGRSFNADKDPEVNEVILLSVTGKAEQSLRLAETVVAAEPDNVDTWFALWAAALAAGERRRADRAIAEVRELDPLRARTLERLDRQASS
jgi:hypothetical protein